jgi:hypothetical protein
LAIALVVPLHFIGQFDGVRELVRRPLLPVSEPAPDS